LILNKFTVAILGLEIDIWDQIDINEKSKFNSVSVFFGLSMFSALVGIYFSMLIVIGVVYQAILITLFLFFIYFNVFRFSLVTIRRSFFTKSNENLIISEELTAPENNVLPSIKNKLQNLKPSFGGIVRTVVYVILIQILVFGFVVLVNWSKIENDSVLIRERILSNYTNSIERNQVQLLERLNLSLCTINSKIEDLKSMNANSSDYYQNLIKQKGSLENEIFEFSQNSKAIMSQSVANFKDQIENNFFPIKIISDSNYHRSFLLFEIVFIILFFIPVRLLKKLKENSDFKYAELSNERFIQTVKLDYKHLEELFDKRIKKYNQSAELNSVWANAPFNTEYKLNPQKRTSISFSQFLNT